MLTHAHQYVPEVLTSSGIGGSGTCHCQVLPLVTAPTETNQLQVAGMTSNE